MCLPARNGGLVIYLSGSIPLRLNERPRPANRTISELRRPTGGQHGHCPLHPTIDPRAASVRGQARHGGEKTIGVTPSSGKTCTLTIFNVEPSGACPQGDNKTHRAVPRRKAFPTAGQGEQEAPSERCRIIWNSLTCLGQIREFAT